MNPVLAVGLTYSLNVKRVKITKITLSVFNISNFEIQFKEYKINRNINEVSVSLFKDLDNINFDMICVQSIGEGRNKSDLHAILHKLDLLFYLKNKNLITVITPSHIIKQMVNVGKPNNLISKKHIVDFLKNKFQGHDINENNYLQYIIPLFCANLLIPSMKLFNQNLVRYYINRLSKLKGEI